MAKDPVEHFYAIAAIINVDAVELVVSYFEKDKFEYRFGYLLQNKLSGSDRKPVYQKLHRGLVKVSPSFIPKTVDEETISMNKNINHLKLLLNRKDYITEVEHLFESQGKETLTDDELWDFRNKAFDDDKMDNNLVMDLLREKERKKQQVSKSEVLKYLNNNFQWGWYRIHELVSLDSHNANFEFDLPAKQFIKKWISKNLVKADFSDCITVNENQYSYSYLELFIAYFTKRLNLDLNEEILLEFLKIDCGFVPRKTTKNQKDTEEDENKKDGLVDFVKSKLGLERTKAAVLDLLKSNNCLLYTSDAADE